MGAGESNDQASQMKGGGKPGPYNSGIRRNASQYLQEVFGLVELAAGVGFDGFPNGGAEG